MVVLIDTKHIGAAMSHGRKRAHLRRINAAQMLGISRGDLRRIEHGKMPPSNELITRLFHYAYLMICARRGGANCNK